MLLRGGLVVSPLPEPPLTAAGGTRAEGGTLDSRPANDCEDCGTGCGALDSRLASDGIWAGVAGAAASRAARPGLEPRPGPTGTGADGVWGVAGKPPSVSWSGVNDSATAGSSAPSKV